CDIKWLFCLPIADECPLLLMVIGDSFLSVLIEDEFSSLSLSLTTFSSILAGDGNSPASFSLTIIGGNNSSFFVFVFVFVLIGGNNSSFLIEANNSLSFLSILIEVDNSPSLLSILIGICTSLISFLFVSL